VSLAAKTIAAAHHVANCDSLSRRLSQAATLGFMQYNSATQANRVVAGARKTGTGLAIHIRTTGPRMFRMQMASTTNQAAVRYLPTTSKQNLGESQDA
jgi:hypothetical protein